MGRDANIRTFIRRLSLIWLILISLNVILTLASEVIVRRAIAIHEHDAQQLNKYGDLQTRSQNLAFLVLQIAVAAEDGVDNQSLRIQLARETIVFSEDVQQMRDEPLFEAFYNSFPTDSFNRQIRLYLEAIRRIIVVNNSTLKTQHPDVQYVQQSAPILQQVFYAAVTYYQHQSGLSLVELQNWNVIRVTMLLALLGVETWFVIGFVLRRLQGRALDMINEIDLRHQVELELREQQAFSEKIATTVPMIIFTFDPYTRRILYFSRRLINQDTDEMGNPVDIRDLRLIEQFFSVEDRARWEANLQKLMASTIDEVSFEEYDLAVPGSPVMNLLIFQIPFLRDEKGKVTQIIGIVQDITERKQLEDRRKRIEVEQERIKLLADFITNTSHELRTPLATIATAVYVMDKTPDIEKRHEKAVQVNNHIQRINMIIEQTHQLIEFTNVDHPMTTIMLDHLIRSAVAQIRGLNSFSRTIIEQYNDQGVKIWGNQQQLIGAIHHIMDNAMRYSDTSKPITIRTEKIDSQVLIRIEDEGIGIDAEDLNHVFETFYKSNKARTSDGSHAGLGLTIAQQVIKGHKGSMSIQSKVGVGTSVLIWLPIIEQHRHEKPLS